ncbi:hypothetical protein [Methylobacterium aquaticum]|uniref:hypothetical protein n=1 Tax=Methylobacterium aquaticum TaxID=270351 RepID=UPI00193329A4|nr:hypothetical protein [Methylobacterium aquaticum]QRE76515.1 hypothetical protein F1D61_25700 [Methylobacterium aquaticum]
MTIWTGEIVDSLSMGGYFRERLSYDDGLHIHAVIARDLRIIIASAFLQAEKPAPCDGSGASRQDAKRLDPKDDSAVDEASSEVEAPDLLSELDDAVSILNSNDAPYCASAVERAAKMLKTQAAEIDQLTIALAESERQKLDDRRHAAALAEAVWHALDDMGAEGRSICPAAKARLRVAYEPFRWTDDAGNDGLDMPMEVARAILVECGLATPTQETPHVES